MRTNPTAEDMQWCPYCKRQVPLTMHVHGVSQPTPAVCDQRTYAVNDTDYMPCNAPASVEVFDIDGEWHPRCQPHVPIFARAEDEATRLRVIT